MSPKISVVVPVYKVEQYLPRCVDSILSQSFTDFELLLVDDGSPDNSGTICDEYALKDSRVKVIHKENGGVSTARNVGIENAKGEWITFIDADDYVEQGFLSIPDSTSADLLVQDYLILRNGQCIHNEHEKMVVHSTEMHSFINKNIDNLIFRVPWAKFFNRKKLAEAGLLFAEGVKIGEDTLFVLDYLYQTKSIQYLSTARYVYKDDEDTFNKYRLPLQKCLEITGLFVERYDRLNADSVPFLNLTNLLFYNLIYPRNYVTLVRWHSNKKVIRICKAINADYGWRWACKYAMYLMKQRILKIFG